MSAGAGAAADRLRASLPPPATVGLAAPDGRLAADLARQGYHVLLWLPADAPMEPPAPGVTRLSAWPPPTPCTALIVLALLGRLPEPERLLRDLRGAAADDDTPLWIDEPLDDGTPAGLPRRRVEEALAGAGWVVRRYEAPAADGDVDGAGRSSPMRGLWECRRSPYVVRGYTPGMEQAVLSAFQAVFATERSAAHWRWKFRDNPWGGPHVSTAWDGERLIAHYTAYPVPLWRGGRELRVLHVGDTFTEPAYRGVGRGATSLLARIVRHFHWCYCRGHVPFFFGFVTGRHRRLGQLVLDYRVAAPVEEWVLERARFVPWLRGRGFALALRGYRVVVTREVGPWADAVFRRARARYPWLVARGARYLRWRYRDHPDHEYRFLVVYRWGRPVGWWLVRAEGDVLRVGDALFATRGVDAARAGLALGLRRLAREGCRPRALRGWFSRVPAWWVAVLEGLGFRPERQAQALDLCVTVFDDAYTPEMIGENLYFTQGDSDLF